MKTPLFSLFCLCSALGRTVVAEPSPVYPGLNVALQPEEKMFVLIHQGQMIYVTSGMQRALIELTFNERGATYRFKAVNTPSQEIITGGGELFEHYARTPRADGGFDVENKGGQLTIKAGGLELEWSRASSKAGFVYFEPDKTKVFVLDSSYFDRASFVKQ